MDDRGRDRRTGLRDSARERGLRREREGEARRLALEAARVASGDRPRLTRDESLALIDRELGRASGADFARLMALKAKLEGWAGGTGGGFDGSPTREEADAYKARLAAMTPAELDAELELRAREVER